MLTHFLVDSLEPDRAGRVGRILAAALKAVDPREAVKRRFSAAGDGSRAAGKIVDLNAYQRIRIVGVGKAARAMALGVVDVLGERVVDGIIITKHSDLAAILPGVIQILSGGHPVPDQSSLDAGQAVERFLQGGQPGDLILCLISGGGSALMAAPQAGVTLADLQDLTRRLLACGADIREINTLRKHLDRMKGGGLARMAAPAAVVSFILSDVIGSPLDVIASGPTVGDPTTYADGLTILEKYNITDQTPKSIRDVLMRGAAGELTETVKPGDLLFARVLNEVVASNPLAAEAALQQAQVEGFQALLLTTYLQGEAAQVGMALASLLKQIDTTGQPIPRPACLIAGGETTVTIRGSGLGGRNQELALGAVALLAEVKDIALVTLGTDGEDGPTDAAGAVVTGAALARAQRLGLNPQSFLQNNDSYHFFSALGGLLKPGPTGTNVNDLVFLFAF